MSDPFGSSSGASVVVCCHNSAARIETTIEHLARQETRYPWEVVLVNNASTDDTTERAKAAWSLHGAPTSLTIVDEPRLGLSFARERGIKEARYEYVVLCDDDNWLAPDYVETAIEVMQGDARIGALGGQNEPVSNVGLPLWFWSVAASYAAGVQALESGDITDRGLVWGAGMVLRRTVYRRVRAVGTQTLLSDRQGSQLSTGGDGEICKWLILAGYKLWYDERLKLKHFIPAERLTRDYFCRLRAGNIAAGLRIKRYLLVIDAAKTTSFWKRSLRFLEGVARMCIGDQFGRPLVQANHPIPTLVVDRTTREIQLIAKRIRAARPPAPSKAGASPVESCPVLTVDVHGFESASAMVERPPIRATAARLVSTVAPRATQRLQRRWGDSYTQWRIESSLRAAGFSGQVMTGPLSGITYEGVAASVFTPKLLGTYELELWDVVGEILQTQPTLVIDIGAAEGYYAVGIAAKLGDDAKIIAFETNAAARHELQHLAEKNGVATKITCLGECTPSQLGNLLRPDCLVFCDCEGGEFQLLDPMELPQLRNVAILVELHNGVVDDIADIFIRRFSSSHSITHIVARQRQLSDCLVLRGLSRRDVEKALSEKRRVGLQWMWMKPLDSGTWATGTNGTVSRVDPWQL